MPGFSGFRYAVLGLGRSGLATCRMLAGSGAEVLAWDESAEARDRAAGTGVILCDLSPPFAWDDVHALIVSPGIPHLYPKPNAIVAAAMRAGVRLDNDVGLFFTARGACASPPTVIAVTGSNGKSTTASLINHTLTVSGRSSVLIGNIGRAVFDRDDSTAGEFLVVEISSYQAELAHCLEPDVAVFLNLTPDHLDRHGGQGGYFAAKCRLFAGRKLRMAVIGVDEEEGCYLASRIPPDRLVRISAQRDLSQHGDAVFMSDGRLVSGTEVVCDLGAMRGLSGSHNQQNACAAFAALRAAGLTLDQITAGLESFPGLRHRSQIVAEHNGILFVNDSKATNAESAGKALEGYRNIRWIAGGLGKEGGIGGLAGQMGNVRKAYLIGHSGREFALQLGSLPHMLCETMPSAVASAVADARPGDTVLLAPAAASFDQYLDFEVRGDHFIDEVERCLKKG